MIPLIEEPKEHYEEFRMYEKCYFECGNSTKFWHWRTNQPICLECAKTRKVSEIEKCTPTYKPPTKKQYLASINQTDLPMKKGKKYFYTKERRAFTCIEPNSSEGQSKFKDYKGAVYQFYDTDMYLTKF